MIVPLPWLSLEALQRPLLERALSSNRDDTLPELPRHEAVISVRPPADDLPVSNLLDRLSAILAARALLIRRAAAVLVGNWAGNVKSFLDILDHVLQADVLLGRLH